MTNYPADLENEIADFNREKSTDLKFIKVLDYEVTFVEVETSMTDDLLFEFGTRLGYNEARKNIKGRM